MKTKTNLKKLYKALGSWHKVAKELGISYQWLCKLKTKTNPGQASDALDKSIAAMVRLRRHDE